MKDVMNKALLFDGKAMITVWSMPRAAEEGARLHKMTDDAANVYGRVLAVSAYMAAGLKSESDKLTVIVEGDGKLGRIVACGECGAKVRGYVSNPREVLRAGEQPSAMVGGEGVISVIKDMGMEQPYRGYGKVVKGDITSDFAGYFLLSEQTPTALSLDCRFEGGKCLMCGGAAAVPLPGCGEEYLVVLEDIMRNFTDIRSALETDTPKELIERHFGHFSPVYLPEITPAYRCTCSRARTSGMIKAIGRKEAMSIIDECGRIDVHCEFCGKNYSFNAQDIDKLFKEE